MTSAFEQLVSHSYDQLPKYSEIMPGVPQGYKDIKTLGQLLEINYKHISVEEQLRENLIHKLKLGDENFKGIIGFKEHVIPAVNRAALSGHDILFIGQIGQAKTKLAESIAFQLLSPIPVVRGSLTNDIPTTIPKHDMIRLLNDMDPDRISPEFVVSPESEESIRNNNLETRIDWKEGRERYRYVLATPDITVKDLVGQIDAIKIAKRGVELYNIESYSPGHLLQVRYGILCIDELPVLDTRKQVTLLSVLQEGRFTTGPYPVTFKPGLKLFATANPVDYTHSGKIIEPLFDRLRSHIETHYPTNVVDEMLIIVQESQWNRKSTVFLPLFIVKTVARIVQLARSHPEVDQSRGVSVRMAIHSMEALGSEAERVRGLVNDVKAIPRFCDLGCIRQTSKFETSELDGGNENRDKILESIIEEAVKEVSGEYTKNLPEESLRKIGEEFEANKAFVVSQRGLAHGKNDAYDSQLSRFPNLRSLVGQTLEILRHEHQEFIQLAKEYEINTSRLCILVEMDSELTATVVELVLEGLRSTHPPLLDKEGNEYSKTSGQ